MKTILKFYTVADFKFWLIHCSYMYRWTETENNNDVITVETEYLPTLYRLSAL